MGFTFLKRPQQELRQGRMLQVRASTAPSTSLEPRGVYSLVTGETSSGAPVVYTLQAPKAGDELEMVATTLVSSSVAPFHINSGSALFSYATGSTGHDMVNLATQGSAFRAIAQSSSQWLVTSVRGATFSTST